MKISDLCCASASPRGIANRPFTRRFELAEHMQVVAADLRDGLLVIELKREIPEALKPRQYPSERTTTPRLSRAASRTRRRKRKTR
jgi:molecular chaperone IbpA